MILLALFIILVGVVVAVAVDRIVGLVIIAAGAIWLLIVAFDANTADAAVQVALASGR